MALRFVRHLSTYCQICGKSEVDPQHCRAVLAHTTPISLMRDSGKNEQKERRLASEIIPRSQICPIPACFKQFESNQQLRDHVIAEHGITLAAECILCSRKFLNAERLKAHMLDKHGDEMHNLKEEMENCIYFNGIMNSSEHASDQHVLTVNPQLAFPRISTSDNISIKGKEPLTIRHYTVDEILSATGGFSEENLIGEGSLGSVYKAKFHNVQTLVVKNINMVPLSIQEEDQFLEVVSRISRLKHPNIVPLIGYCVENRQNLLVYEHAGSITLDKALHCKSLLPLISDFKIRIQLAIGVALALEYMHSLSPPIAHGNLTATNVMLDEDLRPRVCDIGLSVLRPLSSNRCNFKAADNKFGQEHGQSGSIETDVYAFGVLLLELLTGRRPFDSSRPTAEQCLVKWASNRLHDYGSLEEIVDPVLRRSFSAKALSRCAGIISRCVQPEKKFRPRMSKLVKELAVI